MPDFDALYPGRFLKGRSLDRPRPIRIIAVVGTSLEGEKGEKATGVLKYRAPWKIVDGEIVDKPGEGEIVWCKTNAALTAKALGDERDYAKWSGRVISIWFNPDVTLGRDKVGGIRVFGSPELQRAVRVAIKRPRRKTPDVYVLVPTDAKTGQPREGFEMPASAQDDGPGFDDVPPPEPGADG